MKTSKLCVISNLRYPALPSLLPSENFTVSSWKVIFFPCRYSRGLGIIGDLLGEDHPLNLKNCVCGIVYYCFVALLGMPPIHQLNEEM